MSDVDVLLSMGKMIQSYLLIKVNMSLTYLNIRVQVTEVWVNSHEITQAGLQKGQEILNS